MSFSKTTAALRALAILAAALIAGGVAFAQVSTATISGTVSDSSGAVLPHVKITIRNIDTNAVRTLETDGQGRYNAPELPIGNYELQAALTGFQTNVSKGIQLTVGQAAVVNLALQVGAATERVEVTASAEAVETTSSELGSLVDQHELRDLPLNGRDYSQLILLTPGVTSYSAQGIANQPQFSVAGLRAQDQAILLDGTNTLGWFGQGGGNAISGTSLGIDALAEFQVLTNTYGAQYPGSGAVVNQVTRSGTNSLHGSAYEFLRNNALDARNFFDITSSAPAFRRNQFGATLGGPIEKDKAFFFVNYEGYRQGLADTVIAFVPDNASRAAAVPAVQPVIALYPVANGPDLGNGIAEFIASPLAPTNEDFVVGRVDYNFSDSHSIFVRYLFDNATAVMSPPSNNVGPFGAASAFGTPGNPKGFPDDQSGRNQFASIVDRKIFSATLINIFNLSYTRNALEYLPGETAPAALQAIPGRPAMNIQIGNAPCGGPLSCIGDSFIHPALFRPNNFTVSDEMDWTRGAHSLHLGFEVRRSELNAAVFISSSGDYAFSNLTQFLKGQPALVIIAPPGPPNPNPAHRFFETGLTPFVQDDWKVTKRLTLNLGLRYGFVTNPTDGSNRMSVVFPLTGPNPASGFSPVSTAFHNNPSVWNFDPRFGFAWDAFGDHKTSVRGGFGIFHDAISQRVYSQGFFVAPPYFLDVIINPAFPSPTPAQFAAAGHAGLGGNNWAIDTTPYAEEYNLNIQRKLFKNTVFAIGYVGSHGVHLIALSDANACNPTTPGGSVRAVNFVSVICGPPGPIQNRPDKFLGSGYGEAKTAYTSNYNSLQASFRKRFGQGLDLFASYTYSKALDDGSGAYLGDSAGYWGSTSDPLHPKSDYGVSSFDNRHNFNANVLYQLPFHGNPWVEGWQTSVIGMAHSGEPFTVQDAFDWAQTGSGNAQSRPNEVANPFVAGNVAANPGCIGPAQVRTPQNWFNPCAFVLQPIGTFGNEPRDALLGPGFWDIDFAIIKDTRVTERLSVQFRAEFFNIFNHANLALPGPPVGGVALFTGPNCQFAPPPNAPPLQGPNGCFPFMGGNALSPVAGGGLYNPTAAQITSTGTNTARQIQFGLKLIF